MDLKDKLKYYQSERPKKTPDTEHQYMDLSVSIGGCILDADTLPIIKIEKFEHFDHFYPKLSEDQISEISLPLLTKNQFSDTLFLKNILILTPQLLIPD